MTKFVDSLGLKRLVTKIGEAVGNGTWLPVRKGEGTGAVVEGNAGNKATGKYSHVEGFKTTASEECSHAEGMYTNAKGANSHTEGMNTIANGHSSHAEGGETIANGPFSHAEGGSTVVSGNFSHAEGVYNYNNTSYINMIGVGDDDTRKNAVIVYVGRDTRGNVVPTDPKNGYQYLLGVGGYQGQDIAEGMKSVQEVIADLEKGVAASETMTVEEIKEIMSA